jgi:hypothetical protein
MVTDAPPRKKANHDAFLESERLQMLPLPSDQRLAALATMIETAMKTGVASDVGGACDEFLRTAADFYQVPECAVRVLAARPLRVRERSTIELFGDYRPDTKLIRVWMKTAVRNDITSFGTFLSTLCHEFCHHLDFHRFPFRNSWHTRGFYQRAALLYHNAKGTPVRELVWISIGRGRWRIETGPPDRRRLD